MTLMRWNRCKVVYFFFLVVVAVCFCRPLSGVDSYCPDRPDQVVVSRLQGFHLFKKLFVCFFSTTGYGAGCFWVFLELEELAKGRQRKSVH